MASLDDGRVERWLEGYVRTHGGAAGSVHLLRDGDLHLEATVRIPEVVRKAVAVVPKGKGMAGLAWERGVAVQTCNLQEDSADVKPGARAVDAHAAVAIPVGDPTGAFFGVVGIAFMEEGELPAARVRDLSTAAAGLEGVAASG